MKWFGKCNLIKIVLKVIEVITLKYQAEIRSLVQKLGQYENLFKICHVWYQTKGFDKDIHFKLFIFNFT